MLDKEPSEELISPFKGRSERQLELLNMPRKNSAPEIKVIPSRVPQPEEVVLVSRPLLRTATKVLERLGNNVQAKWAIGGDAGEVMMGVNVNPDYLGDPHDKGRMRRDLQGAGRVSDACAGEVEKKLSKEADVDGKMLPVYTKSHYAEFAIDGVKVEVHGDEQIKVGEWDWGDPLDFTPDFTYISAGKLPIVPLSLKSELYLGLGWLDRVKLISDASLAKAPRPLNLIVSRRPQRKHLNPEPTGLAGWVLLSSWPRKLWKLWNWAHSISNAILGLPELNLK